MTLWKTIFAISATHRQNNCDWGYLQRNVYNIVKNENIVVYYWYGRGQTSLKMIKHDFFENLGKNANLGGAESENFKC